MPPEPARFEPYVTRDAQGRAQFANRLIPVPPPLLRPGPRRRRRKSGCPARSLHARRIGAAIERATRVAEARRWLPCNPMSAHLMRCEDAMTGDRVFADIRRSLKQLTVIVTVSPAPPRPGVPAQRIREGGEG